MRREQRSLQIWSILVCAARDRRTYTYGDLADILGFGGAGVMGPMLDPIMRLCRDRGLPPLTVLVVNGTTGKPGDGIVLDGQAAAERERVFGYDWFSVEPAETVDFGLVREG